VTASRKAVYLPRMSDHAVTVAAAMRHQGLDARVMEPPDSESMAIGLDLCRGRECLPCFLCVGDMVRETRRAGFVPAQSVFFMPTGPGPCRFGQYSVLQRDVLDRLGLSQVEVTSPSAANSYALLGADPREFLKRAWEAIVSADLLLKLLHEHRPYEARPGDADQAYAESLQRAADAVEDGGRERLEEALRWAARRFERLGVDRACPRPLIGIVGELYVMLNTHSNAGLVREVEAAGGEVLQSTFMDWMHFTAWCRRKQAGLRRDYRDWIAALLTAAYQDRTDHRLHAAVAPALRHGAESPMRRAMALLEPHFPTILGTEGVLTMARALDFAERGACGILNVFPFSCMPGIVVAAMAPQLRRRFRDVPWLDLSYDGQENTNIRTRMGAFMHQAAQFARSRPC
jgi:predicted nucleotide-binding protein (sugar kinase/HSP70/actin superfamily)